MLSPHTRPYELGIHVSKTFAHVFELLARTYAILDDSGETIAIVTHSQVGMIYTQNTVNTYNDMIIPE